MKYLALGLMTLVVLINSDELFQLFFGIPTTAGVITAMVVIIVAASFAVCRIRKASQGYCQFEGS